MAKKTCLNCGRKFHTEFTTHYCSTRCQKEYSG